MNNKEEKRDYSKPQFQYLCLSTRIRSTEGIQATMADVPIRLIVRRQTRKTGGT
jgi:hypothetical protein